MLLLVILDKVRVVKWISFFLSKILPLYYLFQNLSLLSKIILIGLTTDWLHIKRWSLAIKDTWVWCPSGGWGWEYSKSSWTTSHFRKSTINMEGCLSSEVLFKSWTVMNAWCPCLSPLVDIIFLLRITCHLITSISFLISAWIQC